MTFVMSVDSNHLMLWSKNFFLSDTKSRMFFVLLKICECVSVLRRCYLIKIASICFAISEAASKPRKLISFVPLYIEWLLRSIHDPCRKTVLVCHVRARLALTPKIHNTQCSVRNMLRHGNSSCAHFRRCGAAEGRQRPFFPRVNICFVCQFFSAGSRPSLAFEKLLELSNAHPWWGRIVVRGWHQSRDKLSAWISNKSFWFSSTSCMGELASTEESAPQASHKIECFCND